MNRAFLIILIPAILVALGYVLMFRLLGLAPSYLRLLLPLVIFLGAAYWLWPGRRRGMRG